jgi:hypothetical protein
LIDHFDDTIEAHCAHALANKALRKQVAKQEKHKSNGYFISPTLLLFTFSRQTHHVDGLVNYLKAEAALHLLLVHLARHFRTGGYSP